MMRKVCTLGVVAILALAVVATSAAMTPKQLYGKLLTTPHSSLPKGYYSAKVGSSSLDKRMKRHHAVGAVQVTLGSDSVVFYIVFPGKADALAYARDRNYDNSADLKTVRLVEMGTVPRYKLPSYWRSGTIEGKNAFGKSVRIGITVMGVVTQNVVAGAGTFSTDNEDSGDVPATIKLLGSAMKHLAKVRG